MPPSIPPRVIIAVLLAFNMLMVADRYLLSIAVLIPAIPFSVDLAMPVRFRLIHYDLISPIDVIGPVLFRQSTRKYPMAPFRIHELLPGHGIVDIDVGHVIIIHMIVSYRPPLWLGADIDIYAHVHLANRIFCVENPS
jgi:hypothetical protein